MQIRDRVIELRRVRASQLRPHPRNWRVHPPLQQNALRGLLAEVGFAGALLARELPDGSLELIDGHLRAETLPDAELPVLVLDVNETEAEKLLALVDPLADLAETQSRALADLLARVQTDNAAVQQVLDELLGDAELRPAEPAPAVPVPESFQVLADCADEAQQQELYERLTREGYPCRLLAL